jgi:hypothetical protein
MNRPRGGRADPRRTRDEPQQQGPPEELDPEELAGRHAVTRVSSFGQAANVLRTGEYQHVHGRWVAVSHLSVKFPRGVVPQDWSNFPSFVDALESRVGGIDSVEFRGVRFDDDSPSSGPRVLEEGDEGAPLVPGAASSSLSFRAVERDVERLFGSVLPAHKSLNEVKFVNDENLRGSLSATLVLLLVSRCGRSAGGRPSAAAAATATRKLRLHFSGFSLDDASLHEMAMALQRGALASLTVRRCHIDAVLFRLLLEAAADSPNQDMGGLDLHEVGNSRSNFLTIDETVLAGGVIERMPVRVLGVASGRWTDAAYESLFRQLRTNTTIEVLHIKDTGRSIHLVDWVLELLNKYNFTIFLVYDIRRDSRGHVDDVVRSNRQVYAVHEQMERLHYKLGDQPHHRALWPSALAQVSRFPTLVHRFLRRGDVDGLADQLMRMSSSAASRNKKRGREVPSDVDEGWEYD